MSVPQMTLFGTNYAAKAMHGLTPLRIASTLFWRAFVHLEPTPRSSGKRPFPVTTKSYSVVTTICPTRARRDKVIR